MMTVEIGRNPVEWARKIKEEVVAPNAAEIDEERRFPQEAFHAFGQSGLLGLCVPEEYGGMGGSLTDLVDVTEVIAESCGSTAMCYLMHCCASYLIAAKSPSETLESYLRTIAQGEAIGTLAFSERGTGAHFYNPEIKASFDENGLVLNGKKHFVTNGDQADFLVTVTHTASGHDGLNMVVVDSEAEGVTFEGSWDGIGLSGNNSIAVVMENVSVSKDHFIGEEGDGMDLIFQAVAPSFLLGTAGVNAGLARGAYQAALEHTKNRTYADGSSLAEIPAVQSYLAEMHGKVETASTFVRHAAKKVAHGEEDAMLHVMQSKIVACESANRVTDIALHVCGGQGYSRALPVERYMRDAKAGSVMGPTTDILKTWIGKSVAGIPLF